MTLAYILDHAVCSASAASSSRSLHLIISQLRTKHSSSNCPNHVRRTKSSVKKRIIVRRTVRSMFGEQTIRPIIKNGLKSQRHLYANHSSLHLISPCKHLPVTSNSGLRAVRPKARYPLYFLDKCWTKPLAQRQFTTADGQI